MNTEAQGRSQVRFTVYQPGIAPQQLAIPGEMITLGRASDCTIPIKDRYLSRKHAEIAPINGAWILKDCGSANGTFLNGMRVDHDRTLRTGDRIRLGDTEIVFEAAQHTTDRILAIADTKSKTTIAIPVRDIDQQRYDTGDPAKLKTLSQLAAELLRALGGRRLQRERPQPLLDLRFQVARTLDLHGDAGELQLGAMSPRLEAAETGGLLDQRAPLLRTRREDGLDLALADDRVHPLAEPEICEQLDEVEAAHRGLVQEVLPLAAAVQAARDGDLGEVDRQRVVGVVEEELDLAEVGRAPSGGAGEEDVVGLLRAQLERAQRAGGPADRVGDVRLARAVRADDHADARLEANLDRVGKRLEAADLDRAEMHRGRTLAIAEDGASRALRRRLRRG